MAVDTATISIPQRGIVEPLEIFMNPEYPTDMETLYCDPVDVPEPDAKYRMTVVIDLDETLVDARSYPCVYVRPYALQVLKIIKNKFPETELLMWSAGDRKHVARCARMLDPNGTIFDYIVAKGPEWCIISPCPKEVDRLRGRDGRCILIDNTPICGFMNPRATIIVPDFYYTNPTATRDTTLMYVLQIIAVAYQLCSPNIQIPKSLRSKQSGGFDITKFVQTHPYVEILFAGGYLGKFQYIGLDIKDRDVLAKRMSRWREKMKDI